MIVKLWCRLGQNADDRSPLVRLIVRRLPTGELLAPACSSKPHRALAGYRQRWTIEPLFANLKTKGFNLEDTHITDPGKLSTLLAVLALTVTLCVKTGVVAARLAPIPIKKHGRRAWSLKKIVLILTEARQGSIVHVIGYMLAGSLGLIALALTLVLAFV
ncbi:MAG: transposase [Pseudomonadota bacterium]|nr:transposase [Pseudomonadota bacterium]